MTKVEIEYNFKEYEKSKDRLINRLNVDLEIIEIFEKSEKFKKKHITKENIAEIIDELSDAGHDPTIIGEIPVRELGHVVWLFHQLNDK